MVPQHLLTGELARSPAPFDALSAEARTSLREIARERRLERGEAFLTQGDAAGSFYVLIEGRAKMTRALAAGRTALLALFGPGDLFGTVPALARTPADASVVALDACRALEIESERFLRLLEERPRLLGALLPALTGHLSECRHCLVELTGSRLEQRFATLFLRLAEDAGETGSGGVRVPIRLTRQDLADLAGTTIESAIRVLSRWRKRGIVETREDGFLLVDLEALGRTAAGGRPRSA